MGGDNHDLGLEIDGQIAVGDDDGRGGAGQAIRCPLIHQRALILQFGVLGALEGAHTVEMDHVARAVDPLIGAWDRGQRLGGRKAHARDLCVVELVGDGAQDRGAAVPVVSAALRLGDPPANKARQVARDDDEVAIGRPLRRGEFHGDYTGHVIGVKSV